MGAIILNAHQRIEYSTVVLADNPVLYYEMDDASGNIADSSGNGFTGTAIGTATYQQDGLIFQGNSIELDGTGDAFSFNPTGMAYSSGTVEFWVQGDYDRGASLLEPIITITDTASTDTHCAIWFFQGVLQYTFRQSTGTPGTSYWRVQSDFSFVDETLYHVAVVSGSPSPTFYVNGSATGKSTDTGTPNGQWFGNLTGENAAFVGRFQTSGADYYFPGNLDEVVHYNNNQLSAQTVLNHYNAGRKS